MTRSAVTSFAAMLFVLACSGQKIDLGDHAAGGGSAGNGGAGGVAGTGGIVGTGGVAGIGGMNSMPSAGGPGAYDTDAAVPAACSSAELATRFIVFDSNRTGLQWDIFKMRADGTDVTPLITGPNDEKEPAVSPDGTRLAYSSNKYGAYQIIVRDLATGADTQITSMQKGARQPKWSSDGQQIVFVTDEYVQPCCAPPTGAVGGNIYVVPAREGATPTLALAAGPADHGPPWHFPSFAPGDASIVASTGNALVEAFLDGRPPRDIVPITGRIPSPDYPAISPDGRLVILQDFCGAPVAHELYMIRFDGSTGDTCQGGMQFTNLAFAPGHPAWGSSSYVAFDGGDGTRDIYLLVLGDGTSEPVACKLTNTVASSSDPAWVPAT